MSMTYGHSPTESVVAMLEGTDREKRLRELFETRDPLYSEIADLTIEADHQSAKQLLAEIRDAMDQQLAG